MKPKVLLTCEHGDFDIPKKLQKNFHPNKNLLQSHISYDYGALDICQSLSKIKNVSYKANTITRMLIDMNRVPKAMTQKFRSEDLEHLTETDRKELQRLYFQYRSGIENNIKSMIQKKIPFYVFSVHSFIPVFRGKKRQTDIGLLFRTNKKKEVRVAHGLKTYLKSSKALAKTNIHFNRPYRGHTDCFLNDLFNKYDRSPYLLGGCFLEFNHSLLKKKFSVVTQELGNFLKNCTSQ